MVLLLSYLSAIVQQEQLNVEVQILVIVLGEKDPIAVLENEVI